MSDEDPRRRGAQDSSSFMTIRIITPPAAAPEPVTIDAKPIEPELGRDPHDPCRELAPARFRDPTDPHR